MRFKHFPNKDEITYTVRENFDGNVIQIIETREFVFSEKFP